MKLENAARVKTEFQELGSLHLDFMKQQMQTFSFSVPLGLVVLFLGLFLFAFALVRFLDGVAIRLADGTGADAQFLSGGLILLVAIGFFIISYLSLRKTKDLAKQVFYEIREDMRWLRNML